MYNYIYVYVYNYIEFSPQKKELVLAPSLILDMALHRCFFPH